MWGLKEGGSSAPFVYSLSYVNFCNEFPSLDTFFKVLRLLPFELNSELRIGLVTITLHYIFSTYMESWCALVRVAVRIGIAALG